MEKISVKNLVMGDIGTSETVEVAGDVSELELPEEVKASQVRGKVKMTRLEETILVTGKLDADLKVTCVRCLDPIETEAQLELEREFEIDRLTPSDENLYVDKYLNIDLTEPIREELILAIPSQTLCSKECKGICPGCGINLNKESCKCK